MIKIYRPSLDNIHYPVVWKDINQFSNFKGLSFEEMAVNWKPVEFEFFIDGMPTGKVPDITLITPGIAYRRNLRNVLFPSSDAQIEHLPISVGGSDWSLVNCLKTVSDYDEEHSILSRDSSGTIFIVDKIVTTDSSLENETLFTVDRSNRAVTFVTEPFVLLVKKLKLKGLEFRLVGEGI